jgi:hypothetical protein
LKIIGSRLTGYSLAHLIYNSKAWWNPKCEA